MNPEGMGGMSMPASSPMPQNVQMFSGAQAPVAPIQRPVYERQVMQMPRGNFGNIIEMLKRRRGF
jgi:hypothetical protein